ncbi:polymer-forming cytoskeletal protein [Flaviaesturariibacter amylovorans]|uniref:Polymer-forming cytoskeletal protein n=1 Tax=Flaviaesturariibacter amylovorans TaxID=1084520 RepID=A0ABP8GMA9_9BACT
MFNREKSPEASSNKATLIAAGTTVSGDVQSDHDLRIDGAVRGNVTSTARIVVGPDGSVDGHIESQQADITGRVTGDLRVADLLQLRGTCVVEGNIAAGKLQVEPTATFNGQCQMGGTVTTLVPLKKVHERTAEA